MIWGYPYFRKPANGFWKAPRGWAVGHTGSQHLNPPLEINKFVAALTCQSVRQFLVYSTLGIFTIIQHRVILFMEQAQRKQQFTFVLLWIPFITTSIESQVPQSNPKSNQRPRLHRWQHHSRAWTWFNMGQWSAVLLSLLPECWVSDWPALVLASCQLRLSSISSSTLVNPKRVSHSWRAA